MIKIEKIMKNIYKHLLILSLLFCSAHFFGQKKYLYGDKDKIISFLQKKKIRYEENKPNDSTTVVIFDNDDDSEGLQSSTHLTFKKKNNLFYCRKSELFMQYSFISYLAKINELKEQGYELSVLEYLNEYGFPVYENFISYEGKVDGYIYCSISKLDQDNDKKDDVMVVTYYTDSSEFKIK